MNIIHHQNLVSRFQMEMVMLVREANFLLNYHPPEEMQKTDRQFYFGLEENFPVEP